MLTAKDVAAEIIRSSSEPLGRAKIMKLLYYAQAWNLAWTGKPLFSDSIEAWDMGPVVKSVWAELKHEQQVIYMSTPGPADKAVIDSVTDYYGRFTGKQMIEMTHREDPWIHAYNPGPMGQSGIKKVEVSDMRKFFSRRSLTGAAGPKKPARGTMSTMPKSELHKLAQVAIAQRHGALDLLAKS